MHAGMDKPGGLGIQFSSSSSFHKLGNYRFSERKIHHFHGQALHHDGLQKPTLGHGLRHLFVGGGGGGGAEVGLEQAGGAVGDWQNWDVLAVADFNHVAIWVMEENLLNLVPFVLHESSHVLHPHRLQLALHQIHISALQQDQIIMISSLIKQNHSLTTQKTGGRTSFDLCN